MKPEKEIPKITEELLGEIDFYLDEMIKHNYNHQSIHDYREAIRRFRALLFFFKPYIRNVDFQHVDQLSKHHFNETSLIREIDVFENGYHAIMSEETKEKLSDLKKPLLENIKQSTLSMKMIKFSQIDIRPRVSIQTEPFEEWVIKRQIELFESFIEKDPNKSNNIEKYIHEKRMLSKKLQYVHTIILSDSEALEPINNAIESFKILAKHLHDVCVNLRFVGQYELDDPKLLHQLVIDHSQYLIASDEAYDKVCDLMQHYIEQKNDLKDV